MRNNKPKRANQNLKRLHENGNLGSMRKTANAHAKTLPPLQGKKRKIIKRLHANAQQKQKS
jgi:hypothetical protein